MINCNENKPYIFISYAHKDAKLVMPIINQAENDGYNIWYDEGIDPGTEWDENIARHIENSSYFIAFISENYINSKNCKDELNYSRDLDKKQFLVYLEDVSLPSGMAMRMNRIQAIFWNKYAKDNLNEAFNKLYSADGISIAKAPQFCTNCGRQIDSNSDFCTYCGHPTKKVNIPSETLSKTTDNTKKDNNNNHIHSKRTNTFLIIIFIIVILLIICGILSFKHNNLTINDSKAKKTTSTEGTKNNEDANTPTDNIVITDANPEDIAIAYLYDLSKQNYEGAIALYPDFVTCDENEKDNLLVLLNKKYKDVIENPKYPSYDYIYEYGALQTVEMPYDEFADYKKYICDLFKDTIDVYKLTNAFSIFYSREIYDKNKNKVSFDNYLLYEYVIEYDGKWYILDSDL